MTTLIWLGNLFVEGPNKNDVSYVKKKSTVRRFSSAGLEFTSCATKTDSYTMKLRSADLPVSSSHIFQVHCRGAFPFGSWLGIEGSEGHENLRR